MEAKILNWNSRTDVGIIEKDPDFQDITNFILNENWDWFSAAFSSYDDRETLAFKDKLKGLIATRGGKSFLWHDEEIRFPWESKEQHPDGVLEKIKSIPSYRSGVVTLFEHIDYSFNIRRDLNARHDFYQSLIQLFQERNLKLLLFGSMAFDLSLHTFSPNSPLSKFVRGAYRIPEYRENELTVLRRAKRTIEGKIKDSCEGNLEIVSNLEAFWENTGLENQVERFVEKFMELPIKVMVEEMVLRKLRLLETFLRNNQDVIGNGIQFSPDRIMLKFELGLVKAYLDKTGIFDWGIERGEDSNPLEPEYIFTPKAVFKEILWKSGFMDKKPVMKVGMDVQALSSEVDEAFELVSGLFKTRIPIFLLGPGTALSSGAPNSMELIRRMLHAGQDEKNEILLERYKKRIETWSSYDLKKRLTPLLGHLNPSMGHFYLAQLVSANKTDLILTTNYDTLIEDSLLDYGIRSGDFVKVVGSGEKKQNWAWISDLESSILKLFKLHGDLFYGEKFAFSEKEAHQYIAAAAPMLEQLVETRHRNMFIIVGYNRSSLSTIMEQVILKNSNENRIVVYVTPEPSQYSEHSWDNSINSYDSKARFVEIRDPHFGKFDHFMERLFHELKKRKILA